MTKRSMTRALIVLSLILFSCASQATIRYQVTVPTTGHDLTVTESWSVAASLDPAGKRTEHINAQNIKNGQDLQSAGGAATEWAMVRFSAPNYDVLADSPVEMGDYAEDDFVSRRVPHKIVL